MPIGHHGLIRIPTGTEQRPRADSEPISNPLDVTGSGVPESQLVLSLGYEDDKYIDNNYDKHDNGTNNQCQTDPTRSSMAARRMSLSQLVAAAL